MSSSLALAPLFALAQLAPNGARQPEEREDGQWLRAGKNFANTRYSQLDQINAQNASELKVAWTFSTGLNRGHEAAPIVAGSSMFVVAPYPNVLYALDVTQQGATRISPWRAAVHVDAGLHEQRTVFPADRGAGHGGLFFASGVE